MVTNLLLTLILLLNAFTAITLLAVFRELSIIITLMTHAFFGVYGSLGHEDDSEAPMHTAN